MSSTETDFCFFKSSAYELTQILFLHIFTENTPRRGNRRPFAEAGNCCARTLPIDLANSGQY